MKSLSEYLAYYDPMRESNERYLPEDQETLRYSRVSVIADGKVIGASLYPDHVLDMAFLETPFMRQICRDYQYTRKLEVRIECYEHSGEGEGRGLVGGEFTLFCLGALDLKIVSTRNICLWEGGRMSSLFGKETGNMRIKKEVMVRCLSGTL